MYDQAENLRNIVRQQNQHNIGNAKVITITSGKGGVGKSNTAVNLAVCFRKLGKRVIVFDADFGLANVEVMFGTMPKYTLKDLIYEGKSITDIITKGPMDIGFISGGSGIVGLNNLTHDQIDFLVRSLSKLNELTDVLIIDTGAGVSDSVLEFVVASPEVILITTPEPSSLTDSYSLMKALYKHPGFKGNDTNIRLLANKVRNEEEGRSIYEKLSSVVTEFLHGHISYLGMVPQDRILENAVRSQKVVSEYAPTAASSYAYNDVAKKLMGEDSKVEYRWGITQIFSHFVRGNS